MERKRREEEGRGGKGREEASPKIFWL